MVNKKPLIYNVSILIFSIFIYIVSLSSQSANVSNLGPDFMPKLASLILFIMSVINIAIDYKKQDVNKDSGNVINVTLTFVTLGCYVLLLESVGFIIMTMLYIFVQLCILSRERLLLWKRFLLISVICSVFIYGVFSYVFKVDVPVGFLG